MGKAYISNLPCQIEIDCRQALKNIKTGGFYVETTEIFQKI